METMQFLESARQTLRATSKHLASDVPPELREQLAALEQALAEPHWLTSKDAATLLGVASPTTVKNWLEGGHFPSANRTPGGHWRFLLSEVLQVKEAMERTRRANASGNLAVPDLGDDEPPTPRF